ncbi:MAG: hypothetical protein PF501_00285 [Salinisphaera sp.]|jgi:hypothetical protein|nr:hypothetical protein [Salinisphaera sp.]
MTTAAGLLMLRNDLCLSLLQEARVALHDAEWHGVGTLLREFAVHTELYNRAKEDILYPRFAALAPECTHLLSKWRNEQAMITSHLKKTLESAIARNASACLNLLDRLVKLLSHQWLAEQPLIQTITGQGDKKLVRQLASQLQQSPAVSAGLPACDNSLLYPRHLH